MSDRSAASVRAKLALLRVAAQSGASDDGLAALLAAMDGEAMVTFEERGRGDVQVKVQRVHAVHTPFDDADATVLTFNGVNPMDPKYQLKVALPLHKVVRALREKGWEH